MSLFGGHRCTGYQHRGRDQSDASADRLFSFFLEDKSLEVLKLDTDRLALVIWFEQVNHDRDHTT